MTSLIASKNFSGDMKKTSSRGWFMRKFRAVSGHRCIPADRQYWTLCGNMCDEGGVRVGAYSEYDQLIRERFLRSEQFFGVEINPEVHARNVRAAPHLNLYQGDIIDILTQSYRTGELRPALVNLDTPMEKDRAAHLFGQTLDILNLVEGPMLLVLNVVRESRFRKGNTREILETLLRTPLVVMAYQQGNWSQVEGDIVEYNGTGFTSTKMTTLVCQRGVWS